MAKDKKNAEATNDESPEGAAPAEPKTGFIKKLLGNKKLLIISGGALLVLLLGGGAAYYFLVFSAPKPASMTASGEPAAPITPPQVAYYDVPDIIVNVQSADGSPAYLKLSSSLELDNADEKTGLA